MPTRFLILTFFLGICSTLFAQPIQSSIIQRLLREKEAVAHVHHKELRGLFLDKIDPKFKKNNQYFLKTIHGVFMGVEGTGCIYRVEQDKKGWLGLVRIDSTVYAGNNFCAANFTMDSSIYSFGGYGFWRTNGLLKKFNFFSKEWDVIPVSDEKPSIYCESGSGVLWSNMDSSLADTRKYGTSHAPSMFWVDEENKRLYTAAQRIVNEAIGDSSEGFQNHFTPAVNMLDLQTKKWTSLGYLIDYGWHHLVQTPVGLLIIGNSDNIYLADFRNNTRRVCNEADLALYRKFFVTDPPQIAFYANGNIYIGSVGENSFDSIPFKESHFLSSNKPLYRELDNSAPKISLPGFFVSPWVLYPSGVALGIILGFILLGVFKRNSSTQSRSWRGMLNTSVTPAERVNMLTQTERGLIELIYNLSLKGEKATIEDVNRVIGVAGKNEPIKRRVRSEIINSVNEKWMIISASRDKLIESIKSSEDKRAREYYISTELLASPVFTALLQQEE